MAKSNAAFFAVVALAAALFIGAISTLVLPIQPPLITGPGVSGRSPTVNIVLYAGEISASTFGFGLSASNLTSPGPTLRFTTSDVVNLTLINVGAVPHAFAVVDAPKTGATVLFNSGIASAANPVQPGGTGSVIFSPNSPNDQYYYICPVPGHPELGMYGACVVTVG
ncbi:MAG: hypothetical protein ACE14S_00875 [Candidatus Bathyarchaeia archaeon]